MTAVRPNAVSVANGYYPAYQGSAMQASHGASQSLHVSAPNNTADYEALRNQAHETYRNGDFHRALQLCQSVRQPLSWTLPFANITRVKASTIIRAAACQCMPTMSMLLFQAAAKKLSAVTRICQAAEYIAQ